MNSLILCPNRANPERWIYRIPAVIVLAADGLMLWMEPASWALGLLLLAAAAVLAAFDREARLHGSDQLTLRETGIEILTTRAGNRMISWSDIPYACYAHSRRNWSYLILSKDPPDDRQIRKLVRRQGLFGSYLYDSAVVLPLQSFSRSNPEVQELMDFVEAHTSAQVYPDPFRHC